MSGTQNKNQAQGGSHRTGSSGRPPQKRKRHRKRKSAGKKGKAWKALMVLAVVIGFAVVGAGLGTVFGVLQGTNMLNTADVTPESYTSIIFDTNGQEIDKLHGEENREYVKLASIPQHMQQAVIAIEDQRFYEHGGIDMRGIMRALVENIKTFSFSQGASTITQQLIKNEALTNEKKLERKIKEQFMAISLENSLEKQLGSKKAAKDYILELYLNTIALDHGLHGVEAAAQYYFGKHVSELTLAESACLAGVTKYPSAYAPDTNPEKNKERQTLVLNKMKELGFISEAEFDSAMAEDIYANLVCSNTDENTGVANHSYFAEAMIDQIAKDLMKEKNYTKAQAYDLIYSGGLQIHSTVDTKMQSIMETAFMDDSLFPASDGTLDVTYLISVRDTENPDSEKNQTHYEKKKTITSEDEVDAFVASVKEEVLDETHVLVLDKVSISKSLQASMVIMDQYTGEIRAMVGGRGQKPGDSVFNRATQALRQQGSAMKPLASYAPAIDMGLLMPGSIIIDEPMTYGSWSPRNWNGKFLGPRTVRQGIRDSMNILAIKTFMMVGGDAAFEYLESFGFTTLAEEDKAATTALGGLTNGVSTLEQTAAYATIANGGTYIAPHYYTVVYDHQGNVLLDNSTVETHRVIKETTAYMLTDMMEDVVTGGTGTAAALSGMRVSGKTGTTNDTKDQTFYGYTPYYTAGIWMGYDAPKLINGSGNAHLKIWRTIMSQAHEGLSNKEFKKPEGLVTQTFCSASGDQPTEICSNDYYGVGTTTDLATKDFVRADGVCKLHKTYVVCTESGKIAAPTCPENFHLSVNLAADSDGVIQGKPSSIPSGRMDIVLSEVCTIDHQVEPVVPVIPPEGIPEGGGGNVTPLPPTEGGDIGSLPEDDAIVDENFGIN